MRNSIITTAITLAVSFPALAQEVVKISGASERTLGLVSKLKEEIQTNLKVKVETSTTRAPLAVKNMVVKFTDGYTGPDPAQTLKTLEDNKEISPIAPDELIKTQIGQSIHVAMVHPDNPVTILSKEQLKGILDGSIKSWEPITGKKEPLIFIMPTDFAALPKTLAKSYGLEAVKPTQTVKDVPGQFRALKANPRSAITFNSKTSEPVEGFMPKQLATDSSQPLYLWMRKDARPAAMKVFELIKAKGNLDPVR